jgi:hypothetical protein
VRYRMAILGVAAVAAGSISACGSGGNNSPAAVAAMPPPPATTNQSLDTAQVLAQARQTSETSSPYAVNDGALVLTDTSDTTEPLGIDGT